MNTHDFNSIMSQKQRPLFLNYIPGLSSNSLQVPNSIFNSTGNTPQYGLPSPIQTNTNALGYNPINMIPFKINPTHQILVPKSNINSPSMQNENTIQNQVVIKTTPNIIYNKFKITNINSINELHNKNNIQLKRENEVFTGHPSISLKLANKALESICKISYIYNNEQKFGTGFFMKFSDSLNYLLLIIMF